MEQRSRSSRDAPLIKMTFLFSPWNLPDRITSRRCRDNTLTIPRLCAKRELHHAHRLSAEQNDGAITQATACRERRKSIRNSQIIYHNEPEYTGLRPLDGIKCPRQVTNRSYFQPNNARQTKSPRPFDRSPNPTRVPFPPATAKRDAGRTRAAQRLFTQCRRAQRSHTS